MIVDNPNKFRGNIINEFNNFINNKKISKNIELSIYNYTIKECNKRQIIKKWNNEIFILIYKNRLRELYFNLNPKLSTYNDDFYTKVINKQINVKKLETITHQEMNIELWKPLIEKELKKQKELIEGGMLSGTDEFYCIKCKQRKCVYTQVQIRSADEPMTTFVSCLVCGNNFRIN